MKELNINEIVRIKLTETGISILKEHHNNIHKNIPTYNAIIPEIDENGYIEMQLSEAMYVFGEKVYCGNPNLPFDTIIQIPDEHLKKVKNKKKGLFNKMFK